MLDKTDSSYSLCQLLIKKNKKRFFLEEILKLIKTFEKLHYKSQLVDWFNTCKIKQKNQEIAGIKRMVLSPVFEEKYDDWEGGYQLSKYCFEVVKCLYFMTYCKFVEVTDQLHLFEGRTNEIKKEIKEYEQRKKSDLGNNVIEAMYLIEKKAIEIIYLFAHSKEELLPRKLHEKKAPFFSSKMFQDQALYRGVARLFFSRKSCTLEKFFSLIRGELGREIRDKTRDSIQLFFSKMVMYYCEISLTSKKDQTGQIENILTAGHRLSRVDGTLFTGYNCKLSQDELKKAMKSCRTIEDGFVALWKNLYTYISSTKGYKERLNKAEKDILKLFCNLRAVTVIYRGERVEHLKKKLEKLSGSEEDYQQKRAKFEKLILKAESQIEDYSSEDDKKEVEYSAFSGLDKKDAISDKESGHNQQEVHAPNNNNTTAANNNNNNTTTTTNTNNQGDGDMEIVEDSDSDSNQFLDNFIKV